MRMLRQKSKDTCILGQSILKLFRGEVMLRYVIICTAIFLSAAAFVPAICAARRKRSFTRWYIYGFFLFPIAFIHSLVIPEKAAAVRVFMHKKGAEKAECRVYRIKQKNRQNEAVTGRFLACSVLPTALFGLLWAVSLFGISRIFLPDGFWIRLLCGTAGVLCAVFLSAAEIMKLSKAPLIAGEVVRRTVNTVLASLICSLPVYLLEKLLLAVRPQKEMQLWSFLCAAAGAVLFISVLLKIESSYYAVFASFFDYCVISMIAYAMYAAVTLVCMSVSHADNVYIAAFWLKLFNIDYINDTVLENASSIYSAAALHLLTEGIILLSGLLCLRYRRKERQFRTEYRSHAVRMSQKPILRKHIKPNRYF